MASVNSITHSLEDRASSLERGQMGVNILGNVWGRRKPTCELTPPPTNLPGACSQNSSVTPASKARHEDLSLLAIVNSWKDLGGEVSLWTYA